MIETINRIDSVDELLSISKVCEILEAATYHQLERVTNKELEPDAIEKLFGVAASLGMLKDYTSALWEKRDEAAIMAYKAKKSNKKDSNE